MPQPVPAGDGGIHAKLSAASPGLPARSLTECERLSAASLCASDEVPALRGRQKDGLLDGKERLDAAVFERAHSLGAEPEVGHLQGGGLGLR